MIRACAKSPEALQQQVILDWLAAKRILAFRMNTGAVMVERRLLRFGVIGMADVVAFPWLPGEGHPRTLWLEIKSATGRQRPEQKSFAQQVEQHGMHYLLARSVDDVETWLRQRTESA